MNARQVGVLLGTLALASTSWAGQAGRPSVAEMVRLALYVDRDSYYEREPVGFHVGVRNITDGPLTIGLALTPFDHRDFTLYCRRVGHEWVSPNYPRSWHQVAIEPDLTHLVLAIGQERRVAFSVAADPGRGAFLFDTPGDYEVRVVTHRRWARPPDSVESPIVRVRIEPAPDDERRPLVEFWDVAMASLAQNDGASGGPRADEVVPRVMRFVETYPHSLYARHALAGAARHVEDRVRSGKATPEEKALYRQWKDTQESRP